MADARLKIVIDALNNAGKDLNELQKQLGGIEAPTKKASLSLTDLKSGIDMAMGAARTFAAVAKQAFDLSKEGAAVIQTTESFKQMGLSLADLREASGGTIDDMTLMSSAMALLAGASDTLSPALEGSLDELMQIARAASKLNPALGDSAHMFESLALGIKRGSPMILDNLGLTISVAQANEKYAESLGKSVEQLTEEEKKIALLNATLEAGDTLIQQAGGSVDAYTDSWTRAEAAFKNAGDSLKANVAPSLEGTVEGVAKSVTAFSQLVAIVKTARDEYGFLRGSWEAFWSVLGADTDMMDKAAQGHRELVEAIKDESQSYIYLGANAQNAAEAIITNFGDIEQVGAAAKESVDLLAASIAGKLGEEIQDWKDENDELVAKGEALRAKISELEAKHYLTRDQREELAELKGSLAENQEAVRLNSDEHDDATRRILYNLTLQRLSVDGLTSAELVALADVAEGWGLIDTKTRDTIVAIDDAATAFENGKVDVENYGRTLMDAGGYASGLYDILKKIPPRIDVTVAVTTLGMERVPAAPPGGGPPVEIPGFMQAMGGYSQGGMTLVGERGPELVNMPRGAQVYTTKETVNNYTFNLTGNYHTGPTQVDDVRTLAMLYGGR